MKSLLHGRGLASLIRFALTSALLLGVTLAVALPGALATGTIVYDGSPGTGAPPAMLGTYTMTPFGADMRAVFDDVSTVPGPTGDLTLSVTANHRMIGDGWATWSHGYAGSVYFVAGDTVTITLPPNTYAFYLYAESNSFSAHPFTVVADGMSSGPVMVEGNAGATYFGFYSMAGPIASVTVTTESGANGFAVGEFGIASNVPVTTSPRADVAAIIYGGWSGMPVSAWVGGTMQPVLMTAPNHEGYASVLFTFWPPAGQTWQVSVAPGLPADLDPERWEIELLWIETPAGFMTPTSATVVVQQGSQYVLHYQLIDKGVAP